jgi:hypothetical protein
VIVDFEIPDNIKIDNLHNIFNKYKSFKSIDREIKIKSIFSEELLEFDIENTNEIGFLSPDMSYLHDATFIINKITVGIDNNFIKYIKCKIHILETEQGKVLSDLLNLSIVKFKIHLSKSVDEYHQIEKFYTSFN